MLGLSALTWLVVGAAAVGAAGARFAASSKGGQTAIPMPAVDAAWMLVLSIAGVLAADAVHTASNPAWYPVGQDWREFVVLALDIQSGGRYHPVPQRYPFYPWVAVQLAQATGSAVHIALMQVNIVAAGLLPAAVFRLGTAIGPRSLAVAGGWLALFVPTVGCIVGPPTDYLFHGLIHVGALSAGVRAFRSGRWWNWLGFGFALSLLMATSMKSLVFLLVAAPLVGVAMGWTLRLRPLHAATHLLVWLAPMALIWNIYSGIPRWVTEAYSLEYNVYRTQVVVARAHGRTAPLPTDLGWHPSDEKRRGYWGVGRPGAWTNLDKALTFLARGPQHNLPQSVRWQGATEGMTAALHVPSPAWLGLGLLGCLAPMRRRRLDTHLGPILATAWLGGITVAHFLGVMATHYIPRYALVLLITGPLLLLLGAVPWRKTAWLWLVPLGTAVATMTASTAPGWSAIHSSPEAKAMALNPHPDFWAVRDSLTASDRVLDLTGNRILPDLWPAARIQPVPDEETRVSIPPQTDGRRIVVMPGALNLGDPVRKWTGASPGRLRELRPFVFEDTIPSQSLTLTLSGLGS